MTHAEIRHNALPRPWRRSSRNSPTQSRGIEPLAVSATPTTNCRHQGNRVTGETATATIAAVASAHYWRSIRANAIRVWFALREFAGLAQRRADSQGQTVPRLEIGVSVRQRCVNSRRSESVSNSACRDVPRDLRRRRRRMPPLSPNASQAVRCIRPAAARCAAVEPIECRSASRAGAAAAGAGAGPAAALN